MTDGRSKGYGYVVLFASIIGYMGSFGFAYAVVSPILLPISSQFNITETYASLISTVMFIGAAVFAFPGGIITDKWGLRKTVALGQILLLIGWIVSFISTNFGMFLVGRFVIGVGGTVIGIGGATSVVQWFGPRERLIPMGLWSACLPIGIAWGEFLAGEIVSKAGWRTAVLAGIIITVICLVTVVTFVRPGPAIQDEVPSLNLKTKNELGFVDGVLKNRDVWKFNFALLFGFIPLMTATTYWVAWLMNNKGIGSEVLSSSITSLIGLAGIFGAILGGYFASKLMRNKPVFVFPAIVGALAIISYVFAHSVSDLILLSTIIGLTSYMMGTMLNAIPPQLVSRKFIGSEYGLAVIFFYSAGILGPTLIGSVYASSGGLLAPFALMSLSLLGAAIIVGSMKIK